MKTQEITAENLIPKNRLNKFLLKAVKRLEETDPEIARKLKAIRARAKGEQMQFSSDGKLAFEESASQSIIDDLKKSINLLYVKDKSRITAELIKEAEEM